MSAHLMLIFLSLPLIAFPSNLIQSHSNQITPSDDQEARHVAHSFLRRIQKTRFLADVLLGTSEGIGFTDKRMPLSNSFTHKDRRLLNSFKDRFLTADMRSKLKIDDLFRFHFCLKSLLYLKDLYVYSHFPLGNNDIRELEPDQKYPPQVVELLKKSPTMSPLLEGVQVDEQRKINTSEEFKEFLRTCVDAITMMEDYYKEHPPEQMEHYQKNNLFLGGEISNLKLVIEPQGESSNERTRYISVDLPGINLLLNRSKRGLKIAYVGPHQH